MTRTTLLWIAAAAILVLGFAFYRSRFSEHRPNVDSHAAKEIEKAKRR